MKHLCVHQSDMTVQLLLEKCYESYNYILSIKI